MHDAFEKIIEKLEEEKMFYFLTIANTGDEKLDYAYEKVGNALDKSIEIVKQEAERCKGGHFGCNSNGEHEKCNGCGLTYCKSRNKIWFGALDDGTDTNVGSNGLVE